MHVVVGDRLNHTTRPIEGDRLIVTTVETTPELLRQYCQMLHQIASNAYRNYNTRTQL